MLPWTFYIRKKTDAMSNDDIEIITLQFTNTVNTQQSSKAFSHFTLPPR